MKNILILYNPFYQDDVIEQHLKVLKDDGVVAFGKVKAKFRDMMQEAQNDLDLIYSQTKEDNFMQLFLTDYANLYAAKIVGVENELKSAKAPLYYKAKNLEVEKWFIVADLRELVRGDFEKIRDDYLANFTTPSYGGHTFAIYGNSYVYPLIVNMKDDKNYFEDELKFYPNVFKSAEFLALKDSLIRLNFGSHFVNMMHHNSLENIIYAELEFEANKQNPLYDFSTVVLKYSKIFEQEIYIFIKSLIKIISQNSKEILDFSYKVQGKNYMLKDIFTNKPNLGTYGFILSNQDIKKQIESTFSSSMASFVINILPDKIKKIQSIRNESAHGRAANLEETNNLRDEILGVNKPSFLKALLQQREKLVDFSNLT